MKGRGAESIRRGHDAKPVPFEAQGIVSVQVLLWFQIHISISFFFIHV